MDKSGSKSLVTGGAGFIGSHLCSRLLADGREVYCLDNLSTGRMENIDHLMDSPRFHFLHQDVLSPIKVTVDEIFNLACPASPVHYQKDPLSTLKTSVLGAINVLELARQTGARVLQASTSEVYGDPAVPVQAESYWGHVNPIGPRACYDEGKRCAETLFFDYYRQYGVDIKVARIFNTYGPNMAPDDGRMIANFVMQALRGVDLTVHGDGSQIRCLCYIDDTIEGLLKLMGSDPEFTGPVNLGNTEEYRVIDMARYILDITGSTSRICFVSRPVDDPTVRHPVVDLARKRLDWEARTPLSIGLEQTINYFRKFI